MIKVNVAVVKYYSETRYLQHISLSMFVTLPWIQTLEIIDLQAANKKKDTNKYVVDKIIEIINDDTYKTALLNVNSDYHAIRTTCLMKLTKDVDINMSIKKELFSIDMG